MKSILFEKVRIGKTVLKNRIFMSAAASYNGTTEGDIDYSDPILHFDISNGGCALIPTGGVSGIHPRGRSNATRPMLNSDERIPSFKKFADKIHKGGALAILQMTHGGACAAAYQFSIGNRPLSPSFYMKNQKKGFKKENIENCQASEQEIFELISAFGDAAVRAKKANFDGIQIHAAHDSLLSQWFSTLYNLRTDSWGGNVKNRCRLHCEILKEIKNKTGNEFLTVLKLGIEDSLPGGTKAEEGIEASAIIASQGNTDIIEISQGLQDITDMNSTSMKPNINSLDKEAYYRDWTKRVKSRIKHNALVVMQGGLRTPSLMEEIIENGEADFVSMCRPYIREPGIVNRWISGNMSKAACTSCNQCAFNHVFKGMRLKCIFNKD
ncbi:MAG: hypothetical protein A2X47_02155 [Lentisphaerae bacterium GWF2_38_69]|nr:MAG: hypothetical protein A2X47_02155 [Lentisphaerae bacterium GWF2_38_69]